MAKIILTAEEEVMYLRELDRMQDMMPDLEIQVVSEAAIYNVHPQAVSTTHGEDFRSFLHTIQAQAPAEMRKAS
jgi:hypothetical protein